MDRSILPKFPYHRDPVASGSIRESNEPCECCGESRGLLYAGIMYSTFEVASLCPWCIADGTAAEKYSAEFFDADFCDDDANQVEMSRDWHFEVFGKTIGFDTYNPIGWWVHCGEPAEFVERDEPYEMIFECRRCKKLHMIEDLD